MRCACACAAPGNWDCAFVVQDLEIFWVGEVCGVDGDGDTSTVEDGVR